MPFESMSKLSKSRTIAESKTKQKEIKENKNTKWIIYYGSIHLSQRYSLINFMCL